MFAALACFLAVCAGLGADAGRVTSLDLLCFAVASLALHFCWTVALPKRG